MTKIENQTAIIGILGLGYVGLPAAIEFSKKYCVIGYDVSARVINTLSEGRSHVMDVMDEEVKNCLNSSFYPTLDHKRLGECDFIIVCVPTPLTEAKEPDLVYIKSASETIAKILHKGQFIILESTTYPGTTEEVVVPILEETGLKAGVDFGAAYSPERIDPGNKHFTLKNTPKIVGGINAECTEIAAKLYGSVVERIITVNDARTAEAVKMVENIYRNVNIALVNELSLIFEKMGINTWEVIDAASTKPYGFMSFYPGPGVGGHCIPLDPFYLSYKAKKYGYIPRFIEASGEINDFMRMHTVNLVDKGLKKANKGLFGARVTVMGLSYKKNIDDTRESPSIKIIEELVELGAHVRVYDPYASSIRTKLGEFRSEKTMEDAVRGADCAVFTVEHDSFRDIDLMQLKDLMRSFVVVDCRNMFTRPAESCVYMCIGKCND